VSKTYEVAVKMCIQLRTGRFFVWL